MNSLENARMEINRIDQEMANLFEQRMKAVESVIEYKLQNNLPILDSTREKQVIENNLKYIENEKYKVYYRDFMIHSMELSKQYQRSIVNENSVGYQGLEGAFSHIALNKLFKGVNAKKYATFNDVFEAVTKGEIKAGIIPFENSYTGEVGEIFDLLFTHDCYINEIYDLKINHNLLGVKGSNINNITQVYSHHQALSQCKAFLDKFPFEQIPYPNTALAAKYISECNDKNKAAIASKETAELYALDILAENINTSSENSTRFIVISKHLNKTGNRFNLMFTLEHTAGQLANIIQIISKYNFNLESIKSKAIHNLPWQYYFYVEVVGDINDNMSKEMLEEMKTKCKLMKILGVYNKQEA